MQFRHYLLVWSCICAALLIFSGHVPPIVSYIIAFSLVAPVFAIGLLAQGRWPTRAIVVCFFLASVPGLYATAFPSLTLEKLYLYATGLAVFVSLVSIPRTIKNLSLWSYLFVAAVVVLGTVGPFFTRFAAKGRNFPDIWSSVSPFRFEEILDANLLAALLSLSLPLAVALAVSRDSIKGMRSAIRWIAVILLGLVLVLVESRGGYLAGATGLLTLFFFSRSRWRGLAAGLGICLFAAILVLQPQLVLDAESGATPILNWDSRKEVWNRALYIIQDFPFTGMGTGTFSKTAPVFYTLFLAGSGELYHAHNLYLQISVDCGLPALVAFTALVTSALILGWRAYQEFKTQQNNVGSALAAGYWSGLVAMLLHGVVDAPLWLTKPHLVPFFYLGMLISLHRVARQ